ncbi:MAG: dihydrofolate reductase [Chitinivibrionales bacterium]|nr:dihydrofolate reductase [Chitinivibrionales bacterium]
MTEIIIIAAVARNNTIGSKNTIPWSIREDFQHFKELTMGHPCIMGEVTFESLPQKWRPLPGRENIVLTFDKNYHPRGTTIFYDFKDAVAYVKKKAYPKAFITGGATIYRLGMEVADTLELTRINKDIAGDTVFPEIDETRWQLVRREDAQGLDRVSGETASFSFLRYAKR